MLLDSTLNNTADVYVSTNPHSHLTLRLQQLQKFFFQLSCFIVLFFIFWGVLLCLFWIQKCSLQAYYFPSPELTCQ